MQVPRLSDKQKEALRLYNALALSHKLRLGLMLAPGDIQLLSNHTQLHTRSAYIDHAVRTPFCKQPWPHTSAVAIISSALHACLPWRLPTVL